MSSAIANHGVTSVGAGQMNYWRNLLARTGWSAGSRAVQSIAFTSFGAGHGVTTVAANVAHCAAESGSHVVAIDGNLRNPKLHEIFGVSKTPGLLELLSCGESQTRCLRTLDLYNLQVMPVGGLPVSDVDGIDDIGELFKSLFADFDLVVLDLPAVSIQPETANWLAWMDRVVMVVDDRQANSNEAARAAADLRRAGILLTGVIVNKRNA